MGLATGALAKKAAQRARFAAATKWNEQSQFA
jgi:hypothetical protein